jgi:hypothetical protein
MLADGRELIIAPDFESARAFDIIHGRPIHDERRALLKSELAATVPGIPAANKQSGEMLCTKKDSCDNKVSYCAMYVIECKHHKCV